VGAVCIAAFAGRILPNTGRTSLRGIRSGRVTLGEGLRLAALAANPAENFSFVLGEFHHLSLPQNFFAFIVVFPST
jgi:hypothetical protein